jgi:hypothetical protein
MKLLLTSGGVTNESIRAALIGLLGKPLGECRSLFVRRRRGAADHPQGTLGAMGQ